MTSRTLPEAVLAIALAVVVIATAAVFGSDRAASVDPRSSTWVDDRRGTHALFLLLEQVGLQPVRHVDPPRATDDTAVTRVVLAPSWPVTKPEAAALLDWTARGGRLVVVDAPSAPPDLNVDVAPLLAPLGLETLPAGGRAHDVKVALEDWKREARRVHWPANRVLREQDDAVRDPRAGPVVTLASNAEGSLAVSVPFGDGTVVAIADESLVANFALGRNDNAVLAVRLLDAPGRTIAFDEFHHGWTPTGPRGSLPVRLARMLVTTWTGRALLLVAFAGLVYVLGAAVRLGAPVREPPPARRAMREHADALGRLFEQAHASRETLGVLLEGVRRRVAPRIGLAPRSRADDLSERLRRSVAPGAHPLASAVTETAAAMERSDVNSDLNDVELARLAARLAAARRDFLRGGSER